MINSIEIKPTKLLLNCKEHGPLHCNNAIKNIEVENKKTPISCYNRYTMKERTTNTKSLILDTIQKKVKDFKAKCYRLFIKPFLQPTSSSLLSTLD